MQCPHLIDGSQPFCGVSRETLVTGIHDVSLCRSSFWAECPAVSIADALVRIDPATTGLGVNELDGQPPGTRAPHVAERRRTLPHEIPLHVGRLLRARSGR